MSFSDSARRKCKEMQTKNNVNRDVVGRGEMRVRLKNKTGDREFKIHSSLLARTLINALCESFEFTRSAVSVQ